MFSSFFLATKSPSLYLNKYKLYHDFSVISITSITYLFNNVNIEIFYLLSERDFKKVFELLLETFFYLILRFH